MSNLQWHPPAGSEDAARDFTLSGGGRPVTGALWLPDSFTAGTPMVLLGHGASGDRYQAPIPHLCKRLVNTCGYVCLAIDGPVHGLRKSGDGGRGAFFAEMQRPEFVDDMVADWQQAFSAVAAEKQVGAGPLGYFGLSMGTIFGIPLLASALNFSAAVIGLCGNTGAGEIVGERLNADARRIKHPLLFLMQLEDELFPRDGYLSLFDQLVAQDKRLHANPGLHPEVPAEEIDAAFDFLARYLRAAARDEVPPRRIVNPLAE